MTELELRAHLNERARLDVRPRMIIRSLNLETLRDEPKNRDGNVSFVGTLRDGLIVYDQEQWYVARKQALHIAIEARLVAGRAVMLPSELVVTHDVYRQRLAALPREYALEGLGYETIYFAEGDGFETAGFTVENVEQHPLDEENKRALDYLKEFRTNLAELRFGQTFGHNRRP